jgi:hypothetical protein
VAVTRPAARAAIATACDFRLGRRPRRRLLNVDISVPTGTISSCHLHSLEHADAVTVDPRVGQMCGIDGAVSAILNTGGGETRWR